MLDREALKEELYHSHEEFRQLVDEHQEQERRLEALLQKSFPSQEDELEEKRIKRRKLSLKDRMEVILRSQQQAEVSA